MTCRGALVFRLAPFLVLRLVRPAPVRVRLVLVRFLVLLVPFAMEVGVVMLSVERQVRFSFPTLRPVLQSAGRAFRSTTISDGRGSSADASRV